MKKLKTTAQFIQDARKVHGDKYDYSQTEYVGCHKKLVIICRIHGRFEQSASNHLIGQGCCVCGRISTDTKRFKGTDKFIEDARKVHGDKYDYSQTEYVGCHKKIKIVCRIHGVFIQSATKHLCGDGCPVCGANSSIKNRTKTTQDFISEARAVHGNKYDYSQASYTQNKKKVKIICQKHGEFHQSAIHHLRGNACPECAIKSLSVNRTKSTKQFIEEAISVHGDKYDYSLANYIQCFVNVKIVCPQHGEFLQLPSNHVRGVGCPGCANHGFNTDKPATIYFIKFDKPFASFWKVGITNVTLNSRFGSDIKFITKKYDWKLEKGINAYRIEQATLKEFNEYKFEKGFLFDLLQHSGETECFNPSIPFEKVCKFIEDMVNQI
jgi:hypothetical protein